MRSLLRRACDTAGMRRLAVIAFAVAVLAGCGAAKVTPTAERAERGEMAIVDVTVVPMDSERELPHETVVVRGDRIVAMGPVGETKVSANARRIDGAGRYLIPGLIDMHVHLDRASLPLYVANGVTSVRNMSGRPRDLIWRDRIAKGELFGPTIFTTGPMVDGSPPSWNGSVSLVSPSDAEAEVAREQRVGYDFVKILQTLPRDTYDAVVQAAHRHGMRVFGHVPTPVPLEHALAERQDSIEHLTGYIGAVQADDSPFARPGAPHDEPSLMRRGDYVDARKLAAIAAATRDAGVWSCPTLVTLASPLPGGDTEASRRITRFVSPAERAVWDPSQVVWTRGFTDEDWKAARRLFDARVRITRALHDAGAKVVAGTDGPSFDAPGWSLAHELEHLAGAGFTPFEALAAATRDAAELLNQSRELGKIAPGMRADLVLLEGDPLRDLQNLQRRAGIVLRGAWLPESDLRARAEAVAASFETRRDPTADFAPVAAGGGAEVRAWGIAANGVEVGAERLVVRDEPSGGKRWEGEQSVAEPLGARWSVEEETSADGVVEHLRIERRGDEEAGWVEAKRTGGRLVVKGRLPLVGDVAWEGDVPEGTLLLGPTPVSNAMIARKAGALAAGGKVKIAALAFTFDGTPGDPELMVPPAVTELDVTRDAQTGVIAMDVSAVNARYRVEMTLAPSNVPAEVKVDRQGFTEKHVPRR
jgi:sugar phosphate isomerase/epimerase